MMRINLLPPEQRYQGPSLTFFFALALACLFFIYAAIYGYTEYVLWELDRKIEKTSATYQLLLPTENQMQSANAKQVVYRERNDMLVRLSRGRRSWQAVLTRFGLVTPPKVWLGTVTGLDSGYIKLVGVTATYADLASYLHNLASDTVFHSPMLVLADSDARTGNTKFEIVVQVKGI